MKSVAEVRDGLKERARRKSTKCEGTFEVRREAQRIRDVLAIFNPPVGFVVVLRLIRKVG